MTDLETLLAITCGVLAFCWYREHERRTETTRALSVLHMLMKRIGMGHATIVKVGNDGYTIKPTEAGLKAAFEELTLP
jgi:hypothetical protein